MDITHLEHVIIALVIQLSLLPFVSARVAGAIPVAILLGREIAQHEYRLGIQRGWEWGETLPVGMFEGVWRGWTLDSALDVLLPALACGLLAFLIGFKKRHAAKNS
ncbi:hypothetical protein J7J47_19535 [Halomonas sp. ISL-60]|uniref:hypothetical protein n=1 Tax=Halomonas sp. ISL-56 TaxID=2819149 RepID=UPI001BE59D75|nr:hypothetical protein [Halomonas sp. ISL-56]MBT2774421.1 hypothetical protein [Halomonas sp. ISL-60]MBT2802368.1 hypothetical protein [Halomonas sp. ISL-56]